MAAPRHCPQCNDTGVITGSSTDGASAMACPDGTRPWHRRPVPLAEQLRAAVEAGDALADAVRGLDSYAALGGAPMERTERADAALARWDTLRGGQ